MDQKKKWNIGFYIIIILGGLAWTLLMYNGEINSLSKKLYGFLILSVIFIYAFLYSFFNNEACIYGKITVKKEDNKEFYWLMTSFWGLVALFCLGSAIKIML